MAEPPAELIISAVSSTVSGRLYGERLPRTLRPVQLTEAPVSPSARAMPRPAPRVAPATTATRPRRGRGDLSVVAMFDMARAPLSVRNTRERCAHKPDIRCRLPDLLTSDRFWGLIFGGRFRGSAAARPTG